MSDTAVEVKYCQSCIERGFNPPNIATREWIKGVFYCEECFQPLVNNMLDIGVHESAAEIAKKISVTTVGPILAKVYEMLNVPPELQFQKVDDVCRSHDKIFNFHAPALVNRDLESLTKEIEELQMAIFHIKFYNEPLEGRIKLLKEQRREEKNLKSYDDSKEDYAKGPRKTGTSKVKQTQLEKLMKAVGGPSGSAPVMSMEEMIKKAREREFNTLAGNCPQCGGKMPCLEHGGTLVK